MRRYDDAAGFFFEYFHAVRCNGIQRVCIEDERPRVRAEQFRKIGVQTLADARPHADRDAVRGEDVAVDRLEGAQHHSGKPPDHIGKQLLRDAQFGIARARLQACARRQKCRAAVGAARKDRRRSVRSLVRIGAALGKERFHILIFPDFGPRFHGRNADVRDGNPARIIRAVRKQKRLFAPSHCDGLVRRDAGASGNPALHEPAGKIARDDICAAAHDKIDERSVFALDGARQPRPEQTIDDQSIPAARNAPKYFALILCANRFAVGGKLLCKAQDSDILAALLQDTRRDKPVAAVVAAAANKEHIARPPCTHGSADRLCKRRARALHENKGRRARRDRRRVGAPHLFVGICVFHTSSSATSSCARTVSRAARAVS